MRYDDHGLVPDTTYSYQVTALRGGSRSLPSHSLLVTTRTPPVWSAALSGNWRVLYRVIGNSGLGTPVGQRWIDSWQFTPSCMNRDCFATLTAGGNSEHRRFTPFSMQLDHVVRTYSGAVPYEGSAPFCTGYSNGSARGPAGVSAHVTYHVVLSVSSAAVEGRTWTARSWRGTLRLVEYPVYSGAHHGGSDCPPTTVTVAIDGTQSAGP